MHTKPPMPPESPDMDPGPDLPESAEICITPPADRLWPWAATLASANLSFRIVQAETGRALAVPPDTATAAQRELAAYEKDNCDWPTGLQQHAPVAPLSIPTLLTAAFVALALVRFYLLTGPALPTTPAGIAGALRGEAVRTGQWWRAITALTLHVDGAHLLGNAVFCPVLGAGVARFLGNGIGWLLILLSGIGGNLLSVQLQSSQGSAVGASTAAFGALGILAALQMRRRVRQPSGQVGVGLVRVWLPLIGALGILAFLGTGQGTDLGAHALGFVSGLVLGLGGSSLEPLSRRPWVQLLAGMAAVCLPILAWRLALRQ